MVTICCAESSATANDTPSASSATLCPPRRDIPDPDAAVDVLQLKIALPKCVSGPAQLASGVTPFTVFCPDDAIRKQLVLASLREQRGQRIREAVTAPRHLMHDLDIPGG